MTVMDCRTRTGLLITTSRLISSRQMMANVYHLERFHRHRDDSLQLPYQAIDGTGAAIWIGPKTC